MYQRNVEFAKKEEKRNAEAQSSQRRGREELAILKIEVREGIGFEMANSEEASVESPKKPNGGGGV